MATPRAFPTAWLLIIALLPCALPAGAADERAEKQAELEQLKSRIGEVRESLEATASRRSQEERQLRAVEEELGEVRRRLAELDDRSRATRHSLDRLAEQRQALRQKIEAQQGAIAEQLRQAYMMGDQPYLRILLGRDDPAELSRMLVYYRHLSHAQLAQVEAFRENRRRLDAVQSEQEAKRVALEKLQARTRETRDRLDARRDERAAIVARLEARIDSQEKELRKLRSDQKELEALVASLDRVVREHPTVEVPDAPFGQLRGELPAPLKGSVVRDFRSRLTGGIRSRGMLIEAGEGDPVRAVAHGRVVYADWLNGLGLLLIVDHGDGYMSLYGHNESLYADVGDWIDAGEQVAAAGRTGGVQDPGLYFEIRHKGKPVNPRSWCRFPG